MASLISQVCRGNTLDVSLRCHLFFRKWESWKSYACVASGIWWRYRFFRSKSAENWRVHCACLVIRLTRSVWCGAPHPCLVIIEVRCRLLFCRWEPWKFDWCVAAISSPFRRWKHWKSYWRIVLGNLCRLISAGWYESWIIDCLVDVSSD